MNKFKLEKCLFCHEPNLVHEPGKNFDEMLCILCRKDLFEYRRAINFLRLEVKTDIINGNYESVEYLLRDLELNIENFESLYACLLECNNCKL